MRAFSAIDIAMNAGTGTKTSLACVPCFGNYFFYYGFLTQVSSTVTEIFAKEQGTLKRCALLELGLNAGAAHYYHDSCSAPEAELMGTSLFNGLDGGVESCVPHA